MRKILLLVFLIPILQASSLNDNPEDTAKNFYSTVLSFSIKACLPDENQLRRLTPYMSKRLTALIRNALAYSEQFAKDHPPQRTKEGYLILDKPPFSDGDCFSSNVEGVTSFAIGKSHESKGKYQIDLNLVRIDPMSPNKPIEWTDAVHIIKEDGRFVVDDLEFLADWPYANHGSLSKTLEWRPEKQK